MKVVFENHQNNDKQCEKNICVNDNTKHNNDKFLNTSQEENTEIVKETMTIYHIHDKRHISI